MWVKLTSFRDDTTHPRAYVVHFVDTTAVLARMMSSVRLPAPTLGTPLGHPVTLAYEYIFAVEGLESRAIGIRIGRGPL